MFRIADDAAASTERSIKVVNVPRIPSYEAKLLPAEELKNTELWPPVPPLAIGDEVIATGTWTTRAPMGGENDAMGLLVYGSMTNVTQSWKTP